LALYWIIGGNPIAISFDSSNLIPKFNDYSSLALLAGMFLALSGLEANANLASDMKDPKRSYPKAVFFGAFCTLAILVLGSISIAIVIPKSEISLVSGLINAFSLFFNKYNLQWITPIIIFLTIAGSLGEMNAWMFAGTKGLYITGKSGCLPKILQKVNKNDVPVNLMLFQAIMVTIFTAAFICLSSADLAYWILSALSTQMYLVMYICLFLAGIVLRYKQPQTKRIYKIPGGNFGMWVLVLTGAFCCILALTISFFPPKMLMEAHELIKYEISLISGFLFCLILPLIIYAIQKRKEAV
ncbi:MAG: APC family permease, partial [Victivallaceae bacterium]